MSIVLALCSALLYGVSDYCGGRATRSASTFVVALIGQLASMVLTTVVVVVVLADPFPPAADLGWSMAAGLASTAGITAFYFALANGAMTVVAPITAVVSAVVPVAVGIATGERPTAIALGGVFLAIVAVALVSGVGGRAERPTRARIVLVAVVAGTGFGLLFVFLDRTSDDSGLWPLLLAQVTSVPILAAACVSRRAKFPPRRIDAGLMVLAGSLAVAANVAYLVATREGLLSLVAVITSMYPASTVVLATVLDHERMSNTQAVGLGLAIGALGMVGAGS
jgi:drug/metabolite transporter (DMT)-like permease